MFSLRLWGHSRINKSECDSSGRTCHCRKHDANFGDGPTCGSLDRRQLFSRVFHPPPLHSHALSLPRSAQTAAVGSPCVSSVQPRPHVNSLTSACTRVWGSNRHDVTQSVYRMWANMFMVLLPAIKDPGGIRRTFSVIAKKGWSLYCIETLNLLWQVTKNPMKIVHMCENMRLSK